jgi:hypothetical protein
MVDQTLQQGKLERVTRRWWFFLLFVLIQFVPPYASKGYTFPEEWADVIKHVLSNMVVGSWSALYPIFKVIPIVLVASIIVFRNRVIRLFNIYVAISYVIFAVGQSISVTEKYGVAICTINLIMFLAVAGFWLWEAKVLQNEFSPVKIALWRYWVVPLAVLAFWYPLAQRTAKPDFSLFGFYTNGAGMAFCTMTPLYVGLLTLYWPRVNIVTLRLTSLVGLIIGLYNMNLNFLVRPSLLWWNGVLHIPLLVTSLYGLIISLKRPHAVKQITEDTHIAQN